MREDIARVDVTPDALKGTPDSWEGGEEAKEAGVGGVAEWWVGPMVRIKAEEDFDVLKELESDQEYGSHVIIHPLNTSQSRTCRPGRSRETRRDKTRQNIISTVIAFSSVTLIKVSHLLWHRETSHGSCSR